jgi:hypothetical protein
MEKVGSGIKSRILDSAPRLDYFIGNRLGLMQGAPKLVEGAGHTK